MARTKYVSAKSATKTGTAKYVPVRPATGTAGAQETYLAASRTTPLTSGRKEYTAVSRLTRPLAEAMETFRAPIAKSLRKEEIEALERSNIIIGPESVRIAPGRLRYRIPPPPGAVMFSLQFLQANRKYLDTLNESGIKSIRTNINWEEDEEQQKYITDDLMKSAHDRNLELLFLIGDRERNHEYEYDYLNPHICSEITQHFFDLVNRYKPGGNLAQEEGWRDDYGVRYWQIYSEQNRKDQPRPFGYLRFFRACVEGIHAADPAAKIVAGAVAGRFCGGYNDDLSSRNYLDWLFRDDYFKEKVDVIAVHPYRRPYDPEIAIEDDYEEGYFCTLEGELRALKDFVDTRSPDRDLPIWITEVGWYTEGDVIDENLNAAKYMTRTFHYMIDLPFLKRVYWFNLIQDRKDKYKYHLFRWNGTPTQAGAVVQCPPFHSGFPPSHTTGLTGLDRGNLTQRAYFKGQLSRGDEVTVDGFAHGPFLNREYPTHVDVFGPTESEGSDYHWDTVGVFGRTERNATFTVRATGTYLVALRPIPDWEPRYYDVRFSIRRS